MIRKRLMTEINLASLKMKDQLQSDFYSEDFQYILISTLEQKYGGTLVSQRAACIIQRAYRQFRLKRRLYSSQLYEKKSAHYRNHSMPDDLHFLKDDHGTHSSDEYLNKSSNIFTAMKKLKSSKIRDSLSLLLPELQISAMTQSSLSESSNTETDNLSQGNKESDNYQFKVGDILSTKCEEDLENFDNECFKTDSTEDSDSSLDKVLSVPRDSAGIVKLPPPMPVISSNILSLKSDHSKYKTKIFSFEKTSIFPNPLELNVQRPANTPRKGVDSNSALHSIRSPRDSGVSSHSSNTDLLTFEYSGQTSDSTRSHIGNFSCSQRPHSIISSGVTKGLVAASLTSVEKEVPSENDSITENYFPPITEDSDSLFDSSAAPIPTLMTSSKDSGVDADSASATNNPSCHLRRLSFQDKPAHWRQFNRHSCFTGCVSQPPSQASFKAEKSDRDVPPSPWLKSSTDEVLETTNEAISDSANKDLIHKVLYRVAVNLFNRNTTVGLKFMEDHHIFNIKCPMEIANFLQYREVNLQVLAEFISSRNSVFHLQVLRCYLQNMSLQNLSFLEAFDLFTSTFKLPEDSSRINFLIAEFCQYYIRHIQRCPGIDLGALMGLSRVIVLLKSSLIRSRMLSSTNCVLSFPDFVKNIQNCFTGQHVPYNMEMLQKIYINITRSNKDTKDQAEDLVNRIGNIDKCRSEPGVVSKGSKSTLSKGYLQQTYRRLTYCCDVQQSDSLCKKPKKNEHPRSIFVFNDTVIVAKRLSRTSSKQTNLFRTDNKFQCRAIINLLSCKITKVVHSGSAYQITITTKGSSSKKSGDPTESFHFICESESGCDKLLSKIILSQLESQCVEQLRMQQWHCVHQKNDCMCLSVIALRLLKAGSLCKRC